MRVLALATAISLSFALAPASAEESGLAKTYKQGQSAPVSQQSGSRDQERSRGENVQIDRDWKAQENANRTAADRKSDESHQTVGRDWKARPERE